MKMVGKVVVSLVSLILVVGAVIGVVVGVKSFGNSNGGGNGNSIDNGNDVSATQKVVQTICSAAEYKDSCEKTLSQVGNGTSDPKAYITAAFESSLKQVDSAFALSKTLTVPNNNSRIQMGVDDCKDMLEYAVQNLRASMSMVGDNDMHTVKDRLRELQSWLSSVITYQQTCTDSLSEAEAPELKSVMDNGMVDATKLTDNALVVVKKVTEILEAFDIKLPNLNGSGRRLLGNTEEVDKEGYPTWFSAADRKLLAKTDNGNVKPNVVVAKDGSGNFKTIQEAVNACPKNNKGRFIIYVKAGIYKEYVTIPKDKANIYMYGDGPRKTMVTGDKNFGKQKIGTMNTATFAVTAPNFLCKNVGFQNTAGPEGHQAVALRVQADFAAFFRCRIDAYQDTLYVHAGIQFFRNCVISGTVDFIFGDAAVVFQNSLIVVRRPMDGQKNMVTASGRVTKNQFTGIVIQNSRIVPEQKLNPDRFKIPTYLGRPWKQYATVMIMESQLGDLIHPDGWYPFETNMDYIKTLTFREYANTGPGANTAKRVKWNTVKVATRQEAQTFTAGPFIRGDQWLPATTVPFNLGFFK